MNKFKEGQRVVLPADDDEGVPREEGTVDGYSGDLWPGMMIVTVDARYRGRGDDGLRELHEDDARALPAKPKRRKS